MSDAVVHVFDPGEPGKTRDFTCSIRTLTHGMRYFKDVLQKSVESCVVPVEISVHCDVAVFEWLLGYCNGRVTREHITVEGVLPLLIASNFLQMDTLVSDCLSFMASSLVTVAVHQQQLAGQGGDLTALPLELLSRLARLVPERKLEELASLTPAEVRARHLPLVNRLYKYKLEGCLRELRTTVARCSACQGLFSLAERAKLVCPGPPSPSPAAAAPQPLSKSPLASQTQRRTASSTSSSGVHIPDAAWRLQEYLSSLRAQHIPWRGIYWHIWGLVHVVYCHTCMRYVPAAELRSCTFHPQAPVFAATAAVPPAAAAGGGAAAAPRQLATGFYPCCGAAATRSCDPRVAAASGCCAREHRLVPSGQAPGAPLPPGLTPELLATLQHCTSLFTNPSALMLREWSGDEGPQRTGVAASDRRAAAVALSSAASTIVGAAAADGAAAAAATARSPRGRHVSFFGNSSSAQRTGPDGADADGRLVPLTMQAMLSSSTTATASAAAAAVAAAEQRRNGGNANAGLGPAMTATAAALGYSLNGMPGLDLGSPGQEPSQLLVKPPPLQQQQQQQQQKQLPLAAASPQSPLGSQTLFSQATAAAALTNSPLQITGNPLVDTRRVAAAVARRLSRSSGGSSGSGSGAAVAGDASAQVKQLMVASQELHQPQQQQQQQQHYLKQQQEEHHHQQHGRRPVLGTARSFTSLAALQQVAEEDAATRLPMTTSHGSVSLSPPRVGLAQPPWEDWERALGTDPQTSFPAAAAAGAASLRLLLKAAPPPPPQLASGGFPAPAVVLERSPRHRKHPTRSPQHHRGNSQHQPFPTCMFASLNLEKLAPPPPTPTLSNTAGSGSSPDPRDVSPPRSTVGGGSVAAATDRRGPRRASGLPPGEKNPPPPLQQQQVQLQAPPQSYQRHQNHQNQRLQLSQLAGAGGARDRALHRGLSERSSLGPRREATLPPRPMGLTAAAFPVVQRRHSGGSWTHVGTDSGGGEDDDDRPQVQSPPHKCKGNGADWIKRKLRGGGGGSAGSEFSRGALNGSSGGDGTAIGGSSGSLSGTLGAGPGSGSGGRVGGGGGDTNPLQRSVQAVLMQQRQRRQDVQEEQPSHSQQSPPGQNLPHHHSHQLAPAHRQRSAGRVRHGLGTGSWGSGMEAAAAAAAAEEQARRALIEQYKTQKVLSPRPKNVHMIAISELPSGPASGGGGGGGGSSGTGDALSGRVTPCGQSGPGASPGVDNAETPTGTRINPFNGALAGALTLHSPGGSALEVSPDSAGLFALGQDELDAPDPPPPTPATAADPQPARGRKLRMELLYEDDSYRMDLLEKHLLACRPSNRIGTAAVAVGARDQKSLRGKLALAPSSRAAGGLVAAGGTSRGRPLSAAAALYGSRQARPRSRSVSHLQRLQNTYASGPGTGPGYAQSGRVSIVVDASGCRGDSMMGECSGPGGGMKNSYMTIDPRNGEAADSEKTGMGLGYNLHFGGGGFGAIGARRSQEVRPLSAPRTWRYT